MKKTLIALAAVAATSAFAQSSVTLYGVVDIAYRNQEQKGVSGVVHKTAGVQDGALAGNRIGFKGTEDLGGGLKAEFVVEQGISPTSGNLFTQRSATSGPQTSTTLPSQTGAGAADASAFSTSTNRSSWLGLNGGFGTFRVGYQYTPTYEVSTLKGYNQGAEGVYGGDAYHLHGQAIASTRSNALTYITPAFAGGFTAMVQYAFADDQSDAPTANRYSNLSRLGALLNYANGPLNVSLAHQRLDTKLADGTATNNATRSGFLNQLGGSYDFGVAKVSATWNNGNDGGTSTSTINNTYKSWQIGATVPFGKAAFKVTTGAATTEPDGGVRTFDDKGYQLGVTYSLSKRTTAYAFYGQRKDSADGAAAANRVDTRSATAIGLNHTF